MRVRKFCHCHRFGGDRPRLYEGSVCHSSHLKSVDGWEDKDTQQGHAHGSRLCHEQLYDKDDAQDKWKNVQQQWEELIIKQLTAQECKSAFVTVPGPSTRQQQRSDEGPSALSLTSSYSPSLCLSRPTRWRIPATQRRQRLCATACDPDGRDDKSKQGGFAAGQRASVTALHEQRLPPECEPDRAGLEPYSQVVRFLEVSHYLQGSAPVCKM